MPLLLFLRSVARSFIRFRYWNGEERKQRGRRIELCLKWTRGCVYVSQGEARDTSTWRSFEKLKSNILSHAQWRSRIESSSFTLLNCNTPTTTAGIVKKKSILVLGIVYEDEKKFCDLVQATVWTSESLGRDSRGSLCTVPGLETIVCDCILFLIGRESRTS